jgi:hypothetical protein
MFSVNELTDSCISFIRNHTKQVLKSEGFIQLPLETVLMILEDDELDLSEIKLFKYVMNWVEAHKVFSISFITHSNLCKG